MVIIQLKLIVLQQLLKASAHGPTMLVQLLHHLNAAILQLKLPAQQQPLVTGLVQHAATNHHATHTRSLLIARLKLEDVTCNRKLDAQKLQLSETGTTKSWSNKNGTTKHYSHLWMENLESRVEWLLVLLLQSFLLHFVCQRL